MPASLRSAAGKALTLGGQAMFLLALRPAEISQARCGPVETCRRPEQCVRWDLPPAHNTPAPRPPVTHSSHTGVLQSLATLIHCPLSCLRNARSKLLESGLRPRPSCVSHAFHFGGNTFFHFFHKKNHPVNLNCYNLMNVSCIDGHYPGMQVPYMFHMIRHDKAQKMSPGCSYLAQCGKGASLGCGY
jgi:hypothetical protein